MISAEMWSRCGVYHAKIGEQFYRWSHRLKKWYRTSWLCGETYERALFHGKILRVKIKLIHIDL